MRGDGVDLPAIEDRSHGRGRSVGQVRFPAGAGNEAVPRIEQRRAALCAHVKGILRQVVLAGQWLGGRARQVHRREVIDRLRVPVGDVEPDPGREPPRHAGLARVVGRARAVGQHRDRREVTSPAVAGAVGVEPPPVCVLRRRAGPVDGRVGLDVARQVCALGADVADLHEVLVEERPLNAQVPGLRVRRLRIEVHRKDRGRPHEGVRLRVGTTLIRVLEIQALAAVLVELGGRQGADRDLTGRARPVLELVIVDAVARPHGPLAGPGRIPRKPDAWHPRVETLRDAFSHAGVAGKQQALWRIRSHRGLHAGDKRIEPVLDLAERVDALVPQAVVQRQRAREPPLVLGIEAEIVDAHAAGEIAQTLVERHRRAEQQVRDRVVRGEGSGKHVERIWRDGLEHVDAGVQVFEPALHEMRAASPRHAVLHLEGRLLRIARSRDRAADGRVAADVEERRAFANLV